MDDKKDGERESERTPAILALFEGAANTQTKSLRSGKTRLTSVLDITQNNLMVRLQ